MPKIIHLSQWVGLCSSGIFSPPLLFLLLVKCVFTCMTLFQLESPSLAMFLYSCHALSTSMSFSVDGLICVLFAHQFTPVASTAHEAQHAEQCLS